MVFSIDESKYRIVDLSLKVTPPGTEGRPFVVEQGELADGTIMHNVSSHTHVGTHVESPAHFTEGAKRLEDFPLDRFYGRAVLFEFAGIDAESIDGEKLEADLGSMIQDGDIVCFRNTHPDWRRIHGEDRKRLPWLCADGCRWLVERKAKLILIDDFCGIRVANGVESSRENHAILFEEGKEILILEFPDGLEALAKKECFVMALPLNITGIDSVWARAIAIEER